jgi:hypothetical protein
MRLWTGGKREEGKTHEICVEIGIEDIGGLA